MADITSLLKKILNSTYGEDVRKAIHDSIQQCYRDGQGNATDLVARQRIDTILSKYNIKNTEKTLWTGSAYGVGNVITLASGDSISDYDYIDYYFTMNGNMAIKTFPATVNRKAFIREANLPDNGAAGCTVCEMALLPANNTSVTIDKHMVVEFKSDGTRSGTVINSGDSVSGSNLIVLVKIVGRKWVDNVSVSDICIPADGMTVPAESADPEHSDRFASAGAAVRTQISELKSQIAQLEAIPTAVKHAMDTLFQNVAFKNDDVYTDEIAVVHNWATAVNLLSISAVFDSGTDTIYTDDTLEDLKQYLTVTASYDDGTTSEVTTYTLSGELNEGQSAITVTYEGETASFSVMVVAPLYSLPNVAETSLTSGGKTSTIKIEDGLITMAGNLGTVIYVEENGTASTNTNPSNKWFTVNENTDVLFEMRDITWTNSSGSRAVQAKWRNADAVSNLMTASFDMTSSGSGTDGYAKFELNPYTTTRNLSALAVQWSATTTSSNSTASFRIRLFVDGVRYF